MISINNINHQPQNYKTPFRGKPQQKLSNREKLSLSPNNRKINFREGTDLILKGFAIQAVEMLTSVIEHPLKTAALIGGTTLGLISLPLIGIPTAVGGGVLALGFAGLAAGKTIYHATLFAKNNKKGTYQEARRNLQKIGEDTFDLALSSPFAPKAATQIKNFHKYGKIGVNKTLINEIKSAKLFGKLKTLIAGDKELSRNIKFQKAVDGELLSALTETEKAQLKHDLLEFNVHPDKIPQLVLDKYSEITGIKTQPDLRYDSFPSNTYGCARGRDCSIILNDFKKRFNYKAFDNFQQLFILEEGDNFLITYKDKTNGKIINETIKKEIFIAYNNLMIEYAKLAPQSKRILTMVHEREHINQFAQIISKKGYDWIKHTIKPRGKELFDKMVREIPKIDLYSPKSMEIESYLLEATSKTQAGYIKQPIEIGARKVETMALNHPVFRKLNNIFNKINNNSTAPIEQNILLNDARFESANT